MDDENEKTNVVRIDDARRSRSSRKSRSEVEPGDDVRMDSYDDPEGFVARNVMTVEHGGRMFVALKVPGGFDADAIALTTHEARSIAIALIELAGDADDANEEG